MLTFAVRCKSSRSAGSRLGTEGMCGLNCKLRVSAFFCSECGRHWISNWPLSKNSECPLLAQSALWKNLVVMLSKLPSRAPTSHSSTQINPSSAPARPAAAAAPPSSGCDESYGGVVLGGRTAWEEALQAETAVVRMTNQLYRDIRTGGWHFALNQSRLSALNLQKEFEYVVSFLNERVQTMLRIPDVQEEVLYTT
jgi:hypothetical protein